MSIFNRNPFYAMYRFDRLGVLTYINTATAEDTGSLVMNKYSISIKRGHQAVFEYLTAVSPGIYHRVLLIEADVSEKHIATICGNGE
jgi:hypothetical protein